MTYETHQLLNHLNAIFLGISDLTVWTSTLVRTQQTAQFVNAPNTVFKELNEINAGKFEDFTFTEVMQSHPQEYAARQKDKLCYRYPQGMYKQTVTMVTILEKQVTDSLQENLTWIVANAFFLSWNN